jgi:hypothetical protein
VLSAATFGAVFAALFVAHQVADHWVQTNRQAAMKGQPGWAGRLACASHVATYTLTALVALQAVVSVLDLRLAAWRVAAGLAVSAVTHYIADRRAPLLRLAEAMQSTTGKADFYRLGTPRPGRDDNPTLGTGAYALDQSWHVGWLFVAALIIA